MIAFLERLLFRMISFITPQWFLIVSTTMGFFSLIELLYFRPVHSDSKDILQIMLGTVAGAWMMVIGYYFGSSSGSAKKTEIMADSAVKLADDKEKAVLTVKEP